MVAEPAEATPLPQQIRRGLVFDKWPFRLDIDVEYQDWILVAVSLFLLLLWSTPCFCGQLSDGCSKRFMNWVYSRLHVFYWSLLYFTLFTLMFTIGVLPDWSVADFIDHAERAAYWILDRMVNLATSLSLLFGFYVLWKFRERLLVASGLDYMTFFRWTGSNLPSVWHLRSKSRAVEIFVWKVDGLRSSTGKLLKANDVFVECHHGRNEPMRTRVHNNAGDGCIMKESFQMNIDENNPTEPLTLLIKDQSIVMTSELARLTLSTVELCGIEDQTGKRRVTFNFCTDHFVPLGLAPQGQIWVAVAPVDENSHMEDHDTLGCGC
mmetsp:Transcript_61300/g.134289  ORF Transcript_61300/g.134289 Transcript_61300/m.134289 type:complete len:322 (-) Transcript_61300:130-1095(-)